MLELLQTDASNNTLAETEVHLRVGRTLANVLKHPVTGEQVKEFLSELLSEHALTVVRSPKP